MKQKLNYTVITGASAGLGKEMAIECARRGHNLILIALPGSGLPELCLELAEVYDNKTICYECDLANEYALEKMANWLNCNFSIDWLINNAGIGGTQKFEDASADYLDRIIHLNIRATTMITYLMLPELKRHPEALIMNVSSIAAFGPLPFKTIYPASKAFIYSFSRGLNSELKGTGVKVVVVAPGPFISNSDVSGRILKQSFLARLGVLTVREITRKAINGAEQGQKVIVPGLWNKINRSLLRWIPEEVSLSLMSGVMKREILKS
jgi:short-subunit dehydrogenase